MRRSQSMNSKLGKIKDEHKVAELRNVWSNLVEMAEDSDMTIQDSAVSWANKEMVSLTNEVGELKQFLFEQQVELNSDPDNIKRLEKAERNTYLLKQFYDRLAFLDFMPAEEVQAAFNALTNKQKARLKKFAILIKEFSRKEDDELTAATEN